MRSPWILALVLFLSACGEETPAPRREHRSQATEAPALDDLEDAIEPPPPSSWPTRVESLREAVEAFTTVDACIAELQERTPTAVAEGVADLDYDGFLDDVCTGMDAVKRGDVEACDALPISAGRAGCRRRLAIVHGTPGACPDDRVIPGREATCVAWAAHDPGLCRASSEDARCRAVLARDERACRTLRGGDRDRCRAEVRRYGSALGDDRADSPATAEAAVLALDVGEHATHIERDVLERGVRIVPSDCAYTIALANPLGETSLGLRDEPPSFHIELTIAGDARAPIDLPLGPSDAVLSVTAPQCGGLTSIAGAEGTVHVSAFEPRLGGAIAGTIEGTLRQGEARIPVRGRFATSVRDLDPLPARCGAGSR